MSFSFNFSARSVAEANSKLHQVYAPGVVKALVEAALWAMPQAHNEAKAEAKTSSSDGLRPVTRDTSLDTKAAPQFLGVFVEVWGHIDESGRNKSEIQRFIVQPL